MWHGAETPTAEPTWVEEAPEPSRRHATWEEEWSVCFTRVMEGMQDIHHFPFAHSKVDPWRGKAARLDPYECHIEDEVIRQVACMRRDEPEAPVLARFDVACAFPALLALRFGERITGVVGLCPIDRDRTWVWARYAVHTGLGPLMDRLAAWFSLWSEFALVQPDDKRMLASSQPQAATVHDHALVHADAAIAAWHKLRRRHLQQAHAVEDTTPTLQAVAGSKA